MALNDQSSLQPQSHQAQSRHRRIVNRALIAGAVASFLTAAAVGMAPAPEPVEVRRISQVIELPGLSEQIEALAFSEQQEFLIEERVLRGDSLPVILQRMGIEDSELQAFLRREPSARGIFRLMPGRSMVAAVDGTGRVLWLRYVHTPATEVEGEVLTKLLEVRRTESGFSAEEQSLAAEVEVQVGSGVIRSSLFGATDAAGVPDAIALQMAEILGGSIDFNRDLRRDDAFRVIYEVYRHKGEYVRAGRVLALEFVNKGRTHEAVWFQPEGSGGGYYSFAGQSQRMAFLRSPMEFTRMSSGFGRRLHPIHRQWRNHNGVDFAAPVGTPIRVTGDGVVEFAGRQGGYGNVVIVRHSGRYRTLYAHLSAFGQGIRAGATVTQGQRIGAVGCTGWCTGPHLHYEFHVEGRPVDPMTVVLPGAPPLEGSQLQAFKAHATPWIDTIAMVRRQNEALAAVGAEQDAASDAGDASADAEDTGEAESVEESADSAAASSAG